MKIIICAEEAHEEARLSQSVSQSPFFIMADTETGAFESVANPAIDGKGQYGIRAAEALVSTPAVVVVGKRFERKVFRTLYSSGLSLYRAEKGVVKELVEECRAGRLVRVSLPDPVREREEDRGQKRRGGSGGSLAATPAHLKKLEPNRALAS
jgi:predicted Fe-Mo cluster-binding NifX family protein